MSPHYIFQTLFRGDTTGGVAKCRLFSQATPLLKISLLLPIGLSHARLRNIRNKHYYYYW